MRLTLRTMLAFMDDILEPEDAELIGKKIEESEFASKLKHRTRDVMRRLRLGTPSTADRVAGLDANTVAEYLDNTLADDRVLDFEKVCLESDVHLAEVASCHQILALVLGEPAEVDPASRQRMYELPKRVADQVEAIVESSGLSIVRQLSQGRQAAEEPKPERRPAIAMETEPTRSANAERFAPHATDNRGWWPLAAIVSMMLMMLIVVLALTGQFQRGSTVASLLGFRQTEESLSRSTEGPAADQEELRQPTATGTDEPAEAAGGEARTVVDWDQQVAPVESVDIREFPTTTLPPADVPDPSRSRLEASELATLPGGVPFEPQIERALPGKSGVGTTTLAQPRIEGMAPAADSTGQANDHSSLQAAPLPPEPVGVVDAPSHVLLRFDRERSTWQQIPDQAALLSGIDLLSLPTYRPTIRLMDQVRVCMIDGTRISLLRPDENGVSGLTVHHGKLMIEPVEQAGVQLRLVLGDRSGVITFGDAASRLAIDAGRILGSGDPETEPAPLTANLYATSGKILWQEGPDREPLAVNAPVRLTLNDKPLEAVAVQQFPQWIIDDTISLLDERARGTIYRELDVARPVVLGLRELVEHRQKEVAWLALRCLDCVGDFELLVAALDDPDRKPWPDYVVQLQAAVARGPQEAGRVRMAMEKLHGNEGSYLYEILWRYGTPVLQGAAATRLVQYLDHDTLAFRRVAFWNLKNATGLGVSYQPEDPAAKRQPKVQNWKERLEASGLFTPKPLNDADTPMGGLATTPEDLLPGTGN